MIQLVIRQQQQQQSARNYHRNSHNQVVPSQRFIPRRALMYVPGSDERKLNKIPQIKADCICLDCEDGVAFNAKDLARKNIRQLLTSKTQEFFGSSEPSVRVNSVQSNLCSLDLDSILSEPPTDYLLPSSIHLPKAHCSKKNFKNAIWRGRTVLPQKLNPTGVFNKQNSNGAVSKRPAE